jgi:hypothetical protein
MMEMRDFQQCHIFWILSCEGDEPYLRGFELIWKNILTLNIHKLVKSD